MAMNFGRETDLGRLRPIGADILFFACENFEIGGEVTAKKRYERKAGPTFGRAVNLSPKKIKFE